METPLPIAMESKLKITDITESFREKEDGQTLLSFGPEGIRPLYSKTAVAAFVLSEMPLLAAGQPVLRSYALLLPHGHTHVAEVFHFRQGMGEFLTGEFLGSSHIFSVVMPNNHYSPEYDDTIAQALWEQVSGNAKA